MESSDEHILCIVVDLTFPADGILYKKCLEALENVLAWSLFAPHKTSLVGVTTLNSTLQHRLQFVPLGGNFSTVSASLRAVSRIAGNSNLYMTTSDFKDSLFMTISNIVLRLKQSLEVDRAGRTVFAVLTCRDGDLVCSGLKGLPDEAAGNFDTMQVVQLSAEPSAQPRFSTCGGPAREGRPMVQLAVVPAGAARDRLEEVLRAAWFTPRWSDLLPLELELGGRAAAATALSCVASQCVLDPARLPVGDHFALLAAGSGGGARGGQDPRVLRAVCRVAAEGVCEGSLFGQPLRITWAPQSTFQHRDDFQRNAHLFLALSESLADRDEHLVAKLQAGPQPAAASGHFILIPGDECMLLRSIASSELGLPPPPPPPMRYDGALAARAELEVGGALDALPAEEQYRARDFPSGLCAALRLSAGFPQRLSLQQGKTAVSAVARPASPATFPTAALAAAVDSSPVAIAAPFSASPPMVHVVASSSDDDEVLPDVVRAMPLPGSSSATSASSTTSHRPGTGGHPALQDDFAPPPAKRGKFRPLHGVFTTRRRH